MKSPPLTNRQGFVDAHAHIKDAAALDILTSAGVVAARDAGSKDGAGLRIRNLENIIKIVSAGWAIYKQGGYGSLLGVPVRTTGEIRAEILKLKHAGAGIIKVIASGLVSLKEHGGVTAGGFNAEELSFIVYEAAAAGLEVMAHANGEAAIMACAEAGVRSVEHGFFMTERALGLLSDTRIFWVPTVGAIKRAAESAKASDEMAGYINGLIKEHLNMIRRAYEMGVPLAVGTDCVLPDYHYPVAYAAELDYFEQAGLSRDEVIRIACEGGAKLLGI